MRPWTRTRPICTSTAAKAPCPKWARAWPSSCPAPACACCTGRWTCRAPPAARTRPGTTSSRPMLPEAEADLNAWYDQEHLPGLAAVPAPCARCAMSAATRPRYLACYDLHTRDLRQPAVAGGAGHGLEQPGAAVVPQHAAHDVHEDPVGGGAPRRPGRRARRQDDSKGPDCAVRPLSPGRHALRRILLAGLLELAEQQELHQRLLHVHAVLGLVPDHALGRR